MRVRAAITRSSSMTISADCSKGHLVVRALMCGETLEVQDGLLGFHNMLRNPEASALDLATAVAGILTDLATPDMSPPNNTVKRGLETPQLDEYFLTHMCNIVEVFNADAAADEQLSGEILQRGLPESSNGGRAPAEPPECGGGPGGGAPTTSMFPNLLVINRDKAHGGRRILSRTWKCDPYLDAIAQGIVMGSNSVVQRIRHSEVWRARHTRHLRDLQHTAVWKKALTGVVGAKHRFDSWQKPFARVCLSLDAIIATAQAMHEERRHDAAGRFGKAFLRLLDEEAILTLGMLADAGEETVELIRFMDEERADKVELCFHWRRFLDRVTALFVDGRGCLRSGYTGHMLDLLTTERVLYIDNKPKRVGGRAPDALQPVIDRCLARLQNWVTLARDVVAAEFPEFEALQAFSVLRLSSHNERRRWADAAQERCMVASKLDKLARLLKLDTNRLHDQFFDYLPLAQYEFDTATPTCTPLAAWKTILTRAFDSRVHKYHPVDALLQVCIRAGAWGMSTSGVERTFSLARASLTCQRAALSDSHKRDDCFLLSTVDNNQTADNALGESAADVWMRVFGPARQAKKRRPRGRPRKVKGSSLSMKAWTLKRRADVDGIVAQHAAHPGGRAPAGDGDDSGWTAKHELEREFQEQKKLKRAVETMEQGALLPSEQVAIFGSEENAMESLAAYRSMRKKNLSAYIRQRLARRAMQNRHAPTPEVICKGRQVWLDEEAIHAFSPTASMSSRLRHLGATRALDREHADVFVLADVTRPGQRTMWNAVLGGLTLMSVPVFLGQQGPMVAFKAATSLQRKVWLSAGFIERHPSIRRIICARMEAVNVKWRMVNDEEFAQAAEPRRRSRQIVLAFVTQTELPILSPLLPAKSLITQATGLERLANLDRARSSTGLSVVGK